MYQLYKLFGFSTDSPDEQNANPLRPLVKDFVSYSMHFNVFDRILHDTLICYPEDQFNLTLAHQYIDSFVTSCGNPYFFPRTLAKNQISWEKVKKNYTSSTSSTNSIVSDNITNATDNSDSISSDDALIHNNNNGTKKTREIIHDYLGIALLLPDHIYSTKLLRAIISVGPMYPSVSFAISSALEMKAFCSQYNVHSLPKFLFFRKGFLIGRYSGVHNVESVAAQISVWTGLYPNAVPIRNPYLVFAPPLNPLDASSTLFERLNRLLGPSTEPIKAHFEYANLLEGHVFLATLLYVIARLVYILYRSLKQRGATTVEG